MMNEVYATVRENGLLWALWLAITVHLLSVGLAAYFLWRIWRHDRLVEGRRQLERRLRHRGGDHE